MLIRSIYLTTVFFTSFGCTITDAPTQEEVQEMELNYFKDKYGLCYATISSLTYGIYRVVSIANVPCNKIGK